MNRELIRVATGYLGDLRGRVVADLFCGIEFQFAPARQGCRVVGAEASSEAIAMAQRNARRSTVSNISASSLLRTCTALQVRLSLCPNRVRRPMHCCLTHRVAVQALIWKLDEAVVDKAGGHVSCNPQSFAEDAQRLQQAGFRLREVGVYDMFPQTAHIETVGNFMRNA